MSVAYAIIGINKNELLNLAKSDETFIVDGENKGLIKISINNGKDANEYALKKRVALAKMTNRPPDDLQRSHGQSTIYLDPYALDAENTHFSGYTVSLSNPEVVLDKLAELADRHGFGVNVLSEHDEEFQQMFFGDDEKDIDDNDIPGMH